jgi:NAD(P)-dependent dehydrogenase (short-subunit alcohol dehydrogenase family)
MDLSSLESVRAAAAQVQDGDIVIDILICNAGIVCLTHLSC